MADKDSAPVHRAPANIPAPDLVDDEAVVLWGRMLRVTNLIRAKARADIDGASGLPGEHFEVLLRLARHPGASARMTVLADEMSFSSGGFTRLVDRMEKEGLVARAPDPADRRAVRATMTQHGADLLDRALVVHAPRLHGYFLEPLSAQERKVLAKVLGRLDELHSP
ncbi:MarR family winged helix-turn-helix transcriptional regulator [Streptomyces indicus]|uniref:DNA-binding transcriptional regulator, MarR family n=1 Tax=Streptomyces indicus TaxID=417292 RepID=A0A1G9JIP1_9ACTN|nr:MarR family transcriptional regulator [Streptomyces indicus]SDL37125.1 DNA-binding transcriptional regulator, MarR family [Streptomyces indicus]